MLFFVVAVCGILTMLAVRCPHSQLLFEYNYKWQLHGACIPLRRAAKTTLLVDARYSLVTMIHTIITLKIHVSVVMCVQTCVSVVTVVPIMYLMH